MGEAELNKDKGVLQIRSHFILYGNAAGDLLSRAVADDVQLHWNEPAASVRINDAWFEVVFVITGEYAPWLEPAHIYSNTNPINNFFRIEEFVHGNISFVDGINSNTGYFKLDNLLNNSTTAAHEFGHTIGLEHPEHLDIRGSGVPGIMYPRGTVTDPAFQYDPDALPLAQGGTMNPFTRKVLLNDIALLKLWNLEFNAQGKAILGDFTSVWHEAHQP